MGSVHSLERNAYNYIKGNVRTDIETDTAGMQQLQDLAKLSKYLLLSQANRGGADISRKFILIQQLSNIFTIGLRSPVLFYSACSSDLSGYLFYTSTDDFASLEMVEEILFVRFGILVWL
jgi:hypothetical protein